MGNNGHMSGRGEFSCRIDGKAGYLRVFDDRLELVRSGRSGPEVIPLHLVTAVTTGKTGRLLTAVELVAAGEYLELKLPSIDAPRVADLISALAVDAPILLPDPAILAAPPVMPPAPPVAPVIPAQAFEPAAYEPVVFDPAPEDSVMAGFVMPDFSMKVDMPEWTPLADDAAPGDAAPVDLAEIVSQREYVVAEVAMPQWMPLPEDAEADFVPVLEDPAALKLPAVEMPEWKALPETDFPELVLSQIVIDELTPEPVPVERGPITAIEPLPSGSVLAAAAALAELEDMLNEIPAPPEGFVVHGSDEMVANAREILSLSRPAPEGSDEASIPLQPSEAVLTLAAAAALVGGARRTHSEDPELPVQLERPANLPPDLMRRLNRLEVLRNSGIMTETDFVLAEAEILEAAIAATA